MRDARYLLVTRKEHTNFFICHRCNLIEIIRIECSEIKYSPIRAIYFSKILPIIEVGLNASFLSKFPDHSLDSGLVSFDLPADTIPWILGPIHIRRKMN